jgi:hypothetical protein
MTPLDQYLPFFGAFSLLVVMVLGGLWLVWMILWILVPFQIFAMRKRLDEQTLVLQRTERLIAELLQATRALREGSSAGSLPPPAPPAAD